MPASATAAPGDVVIDLRHDGAQYVDAYQADRVIAWLRSSGGSLGERAMKCAAADLLESAELVDA